MDELVAYLETGKLPLMQTPSMESDTVKSPTDRSQLVTDKHRKVRRYTRNEPPSVQPAVQPTVSQLSPYELGDVVAPTTEREQGKG